MRKEIKEKAIEFISVSGMSKARFARCVDLSMMSLHCWFNDTRVLSVKTEERINQFMIDYVSKLTEIVK